MKIQALTVAPVLSLLLLSFGFPSYALERPAAYELWIEGGQEGGVLVLDVDFEANLLPGEFDAVTIRFASEQRPLLVQAAPTLQMKRPRLRDGQRLSTGLFTNQGAVDGFAHRLVLPHPEPAFATETLLVQAHRNGQTVTLVEATIDPRAFSFRTSYERAPSLPWLDATGRTFLEGESKSSCPGSIFRHCCAGGNCSETCICCSGPGFTCSLITCEIECTVH